MELFSEFDDTYSENICKYCLSSLPENTLVRPCKCSNPVHISCFSKWYDKTKKQCEICKDKFSRINQKRFESSMLGVNVNKNIFFPFDDYYPIPSMTNHDLHKSEGDYRFVSALIYLQCERMKDLLKDNPAPKNWGPYLTYFKQGSMPSNYLRRYNQGAYNSMYDILKHHIQNV